MITLKLIRETTEIALSADLKGSRRSRRNVYARIIYSHLSRKYTGKGITEIGREINRNHSTVLHHLKVFPDNLKYDDFKKMYNRVVRLLRPKNRNYIDLPFKKFCNPIVFPNFTKS